MSCYRAGLKRSRSLSRGKRELHRGPSPGLEALERNALQEKKSRRRQTLTSSWRLLERPKPLSYVRCRKTGRSDAEVELSGTGPAPYFQAMLMDDIGSPKSEKRSVSRRPTFLRVIQLLRRRAVVAGVLLHDKGATRIVARTQRNHEAEAFVSRDEVRIAFGPKASRDGA